MIRYELDYRLDTPYGIECGRITFDNREEAIALAEDLKNLQYKRVLFLTLTTIENLL